MAWHTDLEARRRAVPGCQEAYERNLTEATRIARGIHLVHIVCSPTPKARERPTLEECLGFTHIPLSNDKRYWSDSTRTAEATMAWPSSLYLYVGWAGPKHGGLVLLLGGAHEDGDGTVSPTDTGRVLKRGDDGQFRFTSPFDVEGDVAATLARRKAWLGDSVCGLTGWRSRFSEWLASYCEEPQHYWRPGPKAGSPDPDGFYAKRMSEPPVREETPCWIWEARLEAAIPFERVVAWGCNNEVWKARREWVLNGGGTDKGATGELWARLELAECLTPDEPDRVRHDLVILDWLRNQSLRQP